MATLFPKESDPPEALAVYCINCGVHRFYFDPETIASAGIIAVKCPRCTKAMSLSLNDQGWLMVVNGIPSETEPKRKRARAKAERTNTGDQTQ